jgi:NAD(P)H-flavin reductase
LTTDAVIRKKYSQPEGYLDLTLLSPLIAAKTLPGQFVMLTLNPLTDPLLPRPFDVVEVSLPHGTFRLIIKIVGKATKILQSLKEGDSLAVTGPLGTPITDFQFSSMALLVRGCGAAAVLYFLQAARKRNISVHTVLSAATASKLILRAEMTALSDTLQIATDDGSEGEKALGSVVLDKVLAEHPVERIYSCGGGPFYLPYLTEADEKKKMPVFLFLESYMACGFGHCHGCVVPKTGGGYALVCQDGPLFKLSEVRDPCLIYQ